MTTIEIIQVIKAEIERLYNGEAPKHDQQCNFDDGYFTGIDAIAQFIDTLESEKPMNQDGLKEEINKYNKERFDEYFPEQDGDFISEVDFMTCLDRVARHFAKWGADHLKK